MRKNRWRGGWWILPIACGWGCGNDGVRETGGEGGAAPFYIDVEGQRVWSDRCEEVPVACADLTEAVGLAHERCDSPRSERELWRLSRRCAERAWLANTSFTDEAIRACVERVELAHCSVVAFNFSLFSVIDACTPTHGPLEVGQPCEEPFQCQSGWCDETCEDRTGREAPFLSGNGVEEPFQPSNGREGCVNRELVLRDDGVCVLPGEDGCETPCDGETQACRAGRCVDLALEGQSCDEVPCAEGLSCWAGECRLEAGLMESCVGTSCESGLSCVEDVCVGPAELGEECSERLSAEEACTGAVCLDGRCEPLPVYGEGERCNDFGRPGRCADGLVCLQGLSDLGFGYCGVKKEVGEACEDDQLLSPCVSYADCVEGRCEFAEDSCGHPVGN